MATQDGKLNVARVGGSADLAARRSVQAACLGFFVDMFDVYLPIMSYGAHGDAHRRRSLRRAQRLYPHR